ncbi:MAG: hypothetical protein ABTQ32_12200 [Myxococcaceae bacterium]
MSLWVLVTIPMLVNGAGQVGLKLEGVRSELDEWPTPRLEQVTIQALDRTSNLTWAEHYVVVGDEVRGDVAIRGVLAPTKDGAGVRYTWRLATQECPPLSDSVGFDFKSSALTPAGLDAMAVQLAKRAARLLERARENRLSSCIDPADLPTPEEELERRRQAHELSLARMKVEAARAASQTAPPPTTSPVTPVPSTLPPPPPARRRTSVPTTPSL